MTETNTETARPAPAPLGADPAGQRPRPSPSLARVPGSRIRELGEIALGMDGVLRLYFGESNLPTPAFIVESAARALRDGHTFYSENAGLPALRAEIAAAYRRLHGVELDPGSEIVVTASGLQALHLAIRAVIEPGDEALVLSPAWPNGSAIVELVHGVPVAVPLARSDQGFSIDFDALAAAAGPRSRAVLLTSPSNPLGWVATDRRAATAARLLPRPRSLAALRRGLRAHLLRGPRAGGSGPLDAAAVPARRRRRRGAVVLQDLLHDRLAGRLAGRAARPRPAARAHQRVLRVPRGHLRPGRRHHGVGRGRGGAAPDAHRLPREPRLLPGGAAGDAGPHRASTRGRLLPVPARRGSRRLLTLLPRAPAPRAGRDRPRIGVRPRGRGLDPALLRRRTLRARARARARWSASCGPAGRRLEAGRQPAGFRPRRGREGGSLRPPL